MEPKDVCNHILENFRVDEVFFTDTAGQYIFHIRVDASTKFSSFYSYSEKDIECVTDDITSVLIKMGTERDEPPSVQTHYRTEPECSPEKEKELDEEFPVQPNGYRWL